MIGKAAKMVSTAPVRLHSNMMVSQLPEWDFKSKARSLIQLTRNRKRSTMQSGDFLYEGQAESAANLFLYSWIVTSIELRAKFCNLIRCDTKATVLNMKEDALFVGFYTYVHSSVFRRVLDRISNEVCKGCGEFLFVGTDSRQLG